MIIINFQPVNLEDKPIFDKFFQQQRYENCECTFANLFMWQQCYSTEWVLEEDFLCVKGISDNVTFVLPPFATNMDKLETIINKLMAYFREQKMPFMMKGVPPAFCRLLAEIKPNLFQYEEDRDGFDYVYSASDLINLAGRKYSRKRNHIHNFQKKYPNYLYRPLTSDLIQGCIQTTLEWCEKKDCEEDPSLDCEKCAVLRGLENFSYLQLQGGVIIVNGKVEAFTFGEKLNEDTAVVHVEKGNYDMKGIYPIINQDFCRHNWQNMQYINREEDLGIEGLRKAKESYFPVKMAEKYVVTLK